jgi:hypothetical protein
MSRLKWYLCHVLLNAPATPQISNGNGVADGVTLRRVSLAVPQNILAHWREDSTSFLYNKHTEGSKIELHHLLHIFVPPTQSSPDSR